MSQPKHSPPFFLPEKRSLRRPRLVIVHLLVVIFLPEPRSLGRTHPVIVLLLVSPHPLDHVQEEDADESAPASHHSASRPLLQAEQIKLQCKEGHGLDALQALVELAVQDAGYGLDALQALVELAVQDAGSWVVGGPPGLSLSSCDSSSLLMIAMQASPPQTRNSMQRRPGSKITAGTTGGEAGAAV